MIPHEQAERGFDVVVLFIIAVFSFVAHNYYEVMGNVFITLSVGYLLWKWRRDVKAKKNRETKDVE